MSVDRAALFLRDILATPDTLIRIIESHAVAAGSGHPFANLDEELASLPAPPRTIVLTGMGSSRFAALALRDDAHTGDPVQTRVELASALTSRASSDSVLVGISNSGRTPEVVEAIRSHRGTSLTIGLTNHPGRAVGETADVALPLLAGAEESGIASRTYAATLAVLALLAARVGDEHAPEAGARVRYSQTAGVLRDAVAAAAKLRDARDAWLAQAADVLDGADEIHVIGDARDIGALEQAALMLREAPRLRALPMDAGDWLHVGLYTLLPGGRAILFSGTPYDAEIAATVMARGGRLVVVGPPLDGATVTVPLSPTAAAELQPLAAPTAQIPPAAVRAARAILTAGVAELIAVELWGRLA